MKILIIGAGQVGFHIAARLASEDKDVVVIDISAPALRRVADSADVQTIHGSGSSPSVMEEAGVREAEILLAVTNQDETNLVACLLADVMNPKIKKLARVRNAEYDDLQDQLRTSPPHIDTVINPETEVITTIERLMSVPGAVDVAEFAGGRVTMIGIRLEEGTPMTGIKLMELPQKISTHRPLIPAIVRNDQLIIPQGDDRMKAGDIVYFICEEAWLSETLKFFHRDTEPLKKVMIIGGGGIGSRLAERLSQKTAKGKKAKALKVKLVEKNETRCGELSARLEKVVVLQGDGSDQELLMQENVDAMDAVFTLTDDEETNILCSLLSRRLGARKTITKFSKYGYFPLMRSIGIDQVVDPRMAAVNSILQHIRKGKILSAVTLKGEEGEALEAVVVAGSAVAGRRVMDIEFPRGALIAAVLRGEDVIIPTGRTDIRPEDHIIIFTREKAVRQVEALLLPKKED